MLPFFLRLGLSLSGFTVCGKMQFGKPFGKGAASSRAAKSNKIGPALATAGRCRHIKRVFSASCFSAAIRPFFSNRALAPVVAGEFFSKRKAAVREQNSRRG